MPKTKLPTPDMRVRQNGKNGIVITLPREIQILGWGVGDVLSMTIDLTRRTLELRRKKAVSV